MTQSEVDHWFVEETRFDGGWSPVVYVGTRPARKAAEGSVRRFRNEPVRLPDVLKNKPIKVVAKFMSADGEFATVPTDEIMNVIKEAGTYDRF